ncbi:hypothetical protein [Enterobacter phage SDFMU_Pec]|uniref:Uncharacterized protein n=1 Tax=Enterobacter phage SDFMU_Pec TaxID=3076136 RepID=A0AA96KQV7_9CAUD|nr:hypothetical protein [Enterobacter phage SDFMU_Pec]
MRNKWKDWVAFQELEQQYGTFTAIAMMEDAAKSAFFVKHMDADRGCIVSWRRTRYYTLWSQHKCSG